LQANFIEALLDDRVFRPAPILDYLFGIFIFVGLEFSLIALRGRVWLAVALIGLAAFLILVIYVFAQELNWYLDPVAISAVPVLTKILSSFFGPAEAAKEASRGVPH
jgi:hypothetical protein